MFRHRDKIKANISGETPDIYTCAQCGNKLFSADKKFSVGSGFPSFWEHVGESVKQNSLNTYGRDRVQLLCNKCGQHLGHLFEDNRTPSHVRYCINAQAIVHKAS